MNISWIEHNNYEADDLIASAVEQLQGLFSVVVIASTDADFFQILNRKVSLLRRQSKVFSLDDFYKNFNFSPKNYVDYLSLKGDKVIIFMVLTVLVIRRLVY